MASARQARPATTTATIAVRSRACGPCGRARSRPGRRRRTGRGRSRGRRAGCRRAAPGCRRTRSRSGTSPTGPTAAAASCLVHERQLADHANHDHGDHDDRGGAREADPAAGQHAEQAAAQAGDRAEREQDAPHLPVGHGAEPPLLRRDPLDLRCDDHGDHERQPGRRTATRHAATRATVRRASVPGAVATASTATSVDRVSRAVAIRLVRPMKNAGITGIESMSTRTGASSLTSISASTPKASTTPAMKTGCRARRRASIAAMAR